VLEEGSERKSTRTARGDRDVMYTWPCEPNSPHKHDRIASKSTWVVVEG
jgi:hypothetical protein